MLDLKGINAGYGSFQALFDISLTVNAGEAVSVIGPNGAGKTTLMRVISGMTAPFSGEMEMEGKSLSSFPPHQIVELGIAHVPENRRLFPGMTVEDNLKLGAFAKTARGDSAKPGVCLRTIPKDEGETKSIGGDNVWWGTTNVCNWSRYYVRS